MKTEILKAINGGDTVLLADGGSTKMEWLLVRDGHILLRHVEPGVNPLVSGLAVLQQVFGKVKELLPVSPKAAGYYGAGCVESMAGAVADLVRLTFGCVAECGSDLLLAARLLCPDADGLVCILGTGSNSGLFIDGELVAHKPSLGYVFGDEGGGVDMGKRIIADCLRGDADAAAMRQWESLGMTADTVFARCYGADASPAAFIGSVTQAMLPALDKSGYLRQVAEKSLRKFFDIIVDSYKMKSTTRLYFTGGVAYAFADILCSLADKRGLKIAAIERRPFDRLSDESISG